MDSAAINRPRASLAFGKKLRAWLVLGRISNLPTVWSNCLTACWLGGWNSPRTVLLLCLGSSLLYVGGMFLNDVCDIRFDSQFRPERPIVSGALSRRAALLGVVGLIMMGIGLIATINARSGIIAIGLTILIVVYDWTHKWIGIGPLLMAGCRFLLYLTAASAGLIGITPRVIFFATALGIYIVSLSELARSESRPNVISANLWLLLFAPVLTAFFFDQSVLTLLRCLPLMLCIGWAMITARESVRRAVGFLLAGIVLLDLSAFPTTSIPIMAEYLALFGVTLLFQRHIPAT